MALDPTPCHVTPPKPSSGGFNLFHWVAKHWGTIMTVTSYVEIGLGVVSLFTPLGWVAVAAFYVGTALTVATTTTACVKGEGPACGLGIASLGLGGASYKLGEVAENMETLANAAVRDPRFWKPLVKVVVYSAAGALAQIGKYSTGGASVITTGVSSLPCGYIQSSGC
jgi:hypothetical protein